MLKHIKQVWSEKLKNRTKIGDEFYSKDEVYALMQRLYSEFHESYHPILDKWARKLLRLVTLGTVTYPPRELVFRVFSMPVNDIKLVLLGQDPYHGEGQAMGLAFSCYDHKKRQPSLRNIFKEIQNSFPERNYDFKSDNLSRWHDEEGIFLLNTALTVEEATPGSYVDEWRKFANVVIKYIAESNETCTFLLMGKPAQGKSNFIEDKSRIIMCTHPSPLSASRGFLGSKVFKDVEEKTGEIDWRT